MNSSTMDQNDFGWLAQQVLDRIATDPAYREKLRDIPDNVELADDSDMSTRDDVSGYNHLPQPMVDPPGIFDDASSQMRRYFPVARWLRVFRSMGLVNLPMEAFGPNPIGSKEPATEHPPRSGGPHPL